MQCEPDNFYKRQVGEEKDSAVSQVVTLTAKNGRAFKIDAQINASGEAFPCEADRRQRGTVLVRHVMGQSRSLLNRAIYDRQREKRFAARDYTANKLDAERELADRIQFISDAGLVSRIRIEKSKSIRLIYSIY